MAVSLAGDRVRQPGHTARGAAARSGRRSGSPPRSKLPQNRWTGLALPRKEVRNSLSTRSTCTSASKNRCTAAASYGRSSVVVGERHRPGHLVGMRIELGRAAEPSDELQRPAMELGDRSRPEGKRAERPSEARPTTA